MNNIQGQSRSKCFYISSAVTALSSTAALVTGLTYVGLLYASISSETLENFKNASIGTAVSFGLGLASSCVITAAKGVFDGLNRSRWPQNTVRLSLNTAFKTSLKGPLKDPNSIIKNGLLTDWIFYYLGDRPEVGRTAIVTEVEDFNVEQSVLPSICSVE